MNPSTTNLEGGFPVLTLLSTKLRNDLVAKSLDKPIQLILLGLHIEKLRLGRKNPKKPAELTTRLTYFYYSHLKFFQFKKFNLVFSFVRFFVSMLHDKTFQNA